MPANERMDWLVEKAAELGAASIQPLIAERTGGNPFDAVEAVTGPLE